MTSHVTIESSGPAGYQSRVLIDGKEVPIVGASVRFHVNERTTIDLEQYAVVSVDIQGAVVVFTVSMVWPSPDRKVQRAHGKTLGEALRALAEKVDGVPSPS